MCLVSVIQLYLSFDKILSLVYVYLVYTFFFDVVLKKRGGGLDILGDPAKFNES